MKRAHIGDGGPSALVVGGGIAGIQAALDLANRGIHIYLVERSPSIGGHMAMLDKTFPTMDCAICILAPKMIECGRHPNITLLTCSEVRSVEGYVGNFRVRVLRKPRYVDEGRCTGCGECVRYCPVEAPSEFDAGLGPRKAIYVPFPQAVPLKYTIDRERCIMCGLCARACRAGAIDFGQKPEEIVLEVGAIILAVGFKPLDPSGIRAYGYGRYSNVITAIELERILSASGPTGGVLLRPSDCRTPKSIAFIQCVGSRGHGPGYVPFCSAACCMHAVKEAILVKEHEHDADVSIFYTDMRAFGKGFQELVRRAVEELGVELIRGRPARVEEDEATGNLFIHYEDTETGEVKKREFDLVVLSTALLPSDGLTELASVIGFELDGHGFVKVLDPLCAPTDTTVAGVFVCGFCQGPKDISECAYQASCAAEGAMEVLIGGRGR